MMPMGFVCSFIGAGVGLWFALRLRSPRLMCAALLATVAPAGWGWLLATMIRDVVR